MMCFVGVEMPRLSQKILMNALHGRSCAVLENVKIYLDHTSVNAQEATHSMLEVSCWPFILYGFLLGTIAPWVPIYVRYQTLGMETDWLDLFLWTHLVQITAWYIIRSHIATEKPVQENW